jgi:uncharacterized protein involved in outer membrane biogenesis
MRKLLVTLSVSLAIFVLLCALLPLFDLNWAKPWIQARIVAGTGRAFAIRGDFSFSWTHAAQDGWRRFLPSPNLRAKDIVLANAGWSRSGAPMLQAREIDAVVDPFPLLFGHTFSVRSLRLHGATVVLEKDQGARNNWTFKQSEHAPPAWHFAVHSLAIDRGMLRYVDPVNKGDVKADIDTDTQGVVRFRLSGMFNDVPVGGGGRTGGMLTLMQSGVRYPVKATLTVGETTINLDGMLTDPGHPTALDATLDIEGASMADLFPISGLVMPETPKFSTSGHLTASFQPNHGWVRYDKFTGTVGGSDIGGMLEYQHRKPRPLLHGQVASQILRLDDLRRLIGADEEANKKDKRAKIPPGKVFPVSPFKTKRWRTMDVHVRFVAQTIVRKTLSIEHLDTWIKLDDGVLSLAPLDFGIAGGRLTTEMVVDGRHDPARARMRVLARGLRLQKLLPAIENMPAAAGQMRGEAQIIARGNSVAALFGSANGEIKALISQGSVSKFALEAAGLNMASAVAVKLFGDHQVKLNCLAADLPVSNGLMQPRYFVIDTADATVTADGHVNFASETLRLTLHPQSKGVRIFSLRSPLHVKGTFKHPDVGVNKGAVAARAGAAGLLGVVVAPAAALLALVSPGTDEDNLCLDLLRRPAAAPRAHWK